MNKQTNIFDDVPEGGIISYEHLLYYLEQGREVEFIYQGKEYFISYSKDGRTVWTCKTRVSDCFGDRHKNTVDFTKIDGITLAELFKQNKIKITTIF
ncbi:hypothetical protein [Sutcliffiella halmapala]|uniref:hypothetical protein n=1 Tax=Sutcliffiella halmapala TaxID=79882 RepID=UPI000995CFF7|nr:hypothetical protein [Sutcliffiella halmapala]